MSVISITITESSEQIVSGIPRSILLSASIASNIYYTLDGSTPTIFSSVYVGPIIMPTNTSNITLSIFATNGTDSSAIITKSYITNILNDTRLPHSEVTNINNSTSANSLFPFGTSAPNPTFTYLNPAGSGTTVDNPFDPTLPITSLGVDINGHPTVNINAPIESYQLTYSNTDSEGQTAETGRFSRSAKPAGELGNYPATVKVIGKTTPVEFSQEISKTSDKLFNPKALVIFQDTATEDPTNPAIINRQSFFLEPSEITRDGNQLNNVGLDVASNTGTFLKSHYNERTQELTSYFYDSSVNRWIISKSPYTNPNPNAGNLSGMVFGKGIGGQYVYKWIYNQRRVLL